ncbi:hypothetical protein BDV12DRAFT_203326 [Aspergillus spectabilis]
MVNHADVYVRLDITVAIGSTYGLVVQTKYRIRWSKPQKFLDTQFGYFKLPMDLEPIFLELLYRPRTWSQSRNKCESCNTVAHMVGGTDDGLYYVIHGVRDLGRSRHAEPRHWGSSDRRVNGYYGRDWYFFHRDDTESLSQHYYTSEE